MNGQKRFFKKKNVKSLLPTELSVITNFIKKMRVSNMFHPSSEILVSLCHEKHFLRAIVEKSPSSGMIHETYSSKYLVKPVDGNTDTRSTIGGNFSTD
jgi:hypothetical protein